MDEKKFLDLDGLTYFKQKLEENLKTNQTFLDYTSWNINYKTFRNLIDQLKIDLKLKNDNDLLKRPIFIAFDINQSLPQYIDNKYGILVFDSIEVNGYVSFINLYNFETYNTNYRFTNYINILFSRDALNKTQLSIAGTVFDTMDLSNSIGTVRTKFLLNDYTPTILAFQTQVNPKRYKCYITRIITNGNNYNVSMIDLTSGLSYYAYNVSSATSFYNILNDSYLVNNNKEYSIKCYELGYDIDAGDAEISIENCENKNTEIITVPTTDITGNFSNFITKFYDTNNQLQYTSTINLSSAIFGPGDKIVINVENYEEHSLITIEVKDTRGEQSIYDFQYTYPRINTINITLTQRDIPITYIGWPIWVKQQKVEVE